MILLYKVGIDWPLFKSSLLTIFRFRGVDLYIFSNSSVGVPAGVK